MFVTTAIAVAAAATGFAPEGQAHYAQPTDSCRVVPYSALAAIIGPLQTKPSGFEAYGPKPMVGTWMCGATSRRGELTVQAGCHLPYVAGLFYEYAHGIGKPKSQTWRRIGNLGDQAELVINNAPDPVLGRTAAVVVKKGSTLYQVIGALGNPKNVASLRPMSEQPLARLARVALRFSCP